jgi:hypothetical protein
MEMFLARLRCDMVTLTAEDEVYMDEDKIRDVNDRPIYGRQKKQEWIFS